MTVKFFGRYVAAVMSSAEYFELTSNAEIGRVARRTSRAFKSEPYGKSIATHLPGDRVHLSIGFQNWRLMNFDAELGEEVQNFL